MYSNEHIVAVLNAVYIEHKTKSETANHFHMHWNTVYNICCKYKDKVPELKEALYDGRDIKKFLIPEVAYPTRKHKITEEYKQEIQKYYENYLSCQRLKKDPDAYIRALCDAHRVNFEDIVCYNPEKIEIQDSEDDFYEKKREYLKHIRMIRNYRNGIKNYLDVYKAFWTSEIFSQTYISYGSFYRYAKEYWEDDILGGRSFGEYVDEKYGDCKQSKKAKK